MTQNEGTAAKTEGIEAQVRVNLAYAALNRLKDLGNNVFKERKPWSEMLDRGSFSRPPNTSEAITRFRQNVQYFKINYLIIMLATVAICMILNPQSLIVLAILFGMWIYLFILRSSPLVIGGRTIGEREKLIGMSILSFVTIFLLTSVGTVVLSAVMLGCTVIALHGATRVPDDLFIDDSQTAPSIWSILKGEQTGQAQIASVV